MVQITDEQLARCELAFWNSPGPLTPAAVREHEDAFWAAVAAQFPQVRTGDLDPLTSVRLMDGMRTALAERDADGLTPETNVQLGALMREAIDAWLLLNNDPDQR